MAKTKPAPEPPSAPSTPFLGPLTLGLWRPSAAPEGRLDLYGGDPGSTPDIAPIIHNVWKAFWESRGTQALESWSKLKSPWGILVLGAPRGEPGLHRDWRRLEEETESLLVRWFVNREPTPVAGDTDLSSKSFAFQLRPWPSAEHGMAVLGTLSPVVESGQNRGVGQLSAQQILRRLSADLVVEYARGLPPDERESLRGRLQADAGGELRDVGLPPLPETIEFPDAVSARKFLQSLATELRSHVLSQAASLKTALEALSGIGFESHEDLLQILADLQLLGQCGLEFALAKRAASMKAGTPVHLTHENPSSGRPLGRMVAFDATGKANPAKGTTFLPLTVKLPKP